nr:MAG TPA_asm: Putative replisome organizer protein [Bacteriophage sp.]
MILELDTSLFDIYGKMSINQLVFLTLVLNENQSNNQDIHQFLSRISENEIQELVDSNIITVITSGDSKIYSISEDTRKHLKQDKSWFDEFYEVFPVYVTRPDGTKGFLRSNINKCRKEYNRIVGKSRAMHEHLIKCLQFEIDNKMITGKIGYMKTMWKWLTQREWEVTEEEMQFSMEQDINNEVAYGANII